MDRSNPRNRVIHTAAMRAHQASERRDREDKRTRRRQRLIIALWLIPMTAALLIVPYGLYLLATS